MVKPRLFLFDIDGTLLLTRGAGREAMWLAMRDIFGTAVTLDQHEFGGKTDWLSLVELLSPLGYSSEDIARIMPAYDAAMGAHLEAVAGRFDIQPCPGALALVTELHAQRDSQLALVTGNCRSTAPIKLRAAGFDPAMFPVGAYGSEAMSRDALPPLALVRAAAYYRREFAPEDVVVVGDTPADVQCARALGAIAVVVQTGFAQAADLKASQPDYLIGDLTAFDSVLAALDS